MGAAGSVGLDPTAIREEYEAQSRVLSDEDLLKHMKKVIISSLPDEPGGKDGGDPKTGVSNASVRRGSASRPTTHDHRPPFNSSTNNKILSPRHGSNTGRSVVNDRPISAPADRQDAPKGRPRSPLQGKKGPSPTKSRRRSFVGQPAAPADATKGDATPAVDVSAAEGDAELVAKVDSWESVSGQPSCPLCNMAFTSEGKRDQHMKFSPAHTSNPVDSAPEQIPVKAASKTIYSGTKLFWRSGLNVEFFIQQHEEVDAVQVLAFDTRTDREIGQIWVSLDKARPRIGHEGLKQAMLAAEKSFINLGLKPTPEEHAAEAARRAAVTFIMMRIQVEEVAEDGPSPGTPKRYAVGLQEMASDKEAGQWDLVIEQPAGVNPTFSRAAMKRASTQQIDQAMKSLRQSLTDVRESAEVAVSKLEGLDGVVEKGRRGSLEVARRASVSATAIGPV